MRSKKLLATVLFATLSTSLMSNVNLSIAHADNASGVEVTQSGNEVTIGNDFISRTFAIENGKVITKEILNKRANTTFTPEIGSEEFVLNTKREVNKGWSVISTSSQETSAENGRADNAIDGDASTIWHTKYNGGIDKYPHHIAINLGEEKELKGFSYQPRSNGTNGNIKDYEFYVSNDSENWGEPVNVGTFQYNGSNKINVKFDESVSGQYIKLVAKNEVAGRDFATIAELDIIEENVPQELRTDIKTTDLELLETRVEDAAENNGKKVVFDFKPYEFNGVEWDIDMNIIMENGDHFMRKYLEIKVSDEENASIDYIDLEHLLVGEDDGPTWSRPDNEGAFISGYQMGLGQPIYINGMFYGSEFPQTDNKIASENGEDLAHIKYFSGKEFSELDKTVDGKFVTWQTVAGAARSTDESVIQSDFFTYIDSIATRTNFRKQYNSWYDHMMNITSDNIQESFVEIEKGLTQNGIEPVDSYVVDDGWNDYNGDFWAFNSKFPNELYDATEFTEKVSSNFGLWLGPRGGYNYYSGFAKRMQAAGKGGYNPASDDICVGHPEYIKNITALFLDYMGRFDINYWKLDGFLLSPCPDKSHGHMTGGQNGMYMITDTYEQWYKVFETMRDAREKEGKDLFINMTCYINPSPWLLQWVNTVWLQNSNDVGFASSDGGPVQKVDESYMDAMLTYRDDRYFDFYGKRELQFPAANVYNHDPIYGNTNTFGGGSVTMNTEQFRKYLFMLMSRGTAFWELYYSYNMMDDEKWAVNAEVLKWGEENFDILRNAKLIGETPKGGNVYGYSAWNGADGIVSLRNPSNEEKEFTITLDRIIGVGEGAANLSKTTVYPYGVNEDDRTYDYGDTITVTLKPYEVLVWQFGNADEVAPEVTSVKSLEDNKVTIEFNERVFVNKENYSIKGNNVVEANLRADYRTVDLVLENPLTDGEEYTLEVSGVSDMAENVTSNSVKFNASKDSILAKVSSENLDSANKVTGTSDFGVSLMLNTTVANEEGVSAPVFAQGDEYTISVNSNGKLEFTVKGLTVTSKKSVNDGADHHITAMREKNGMLKIYIDGKLDSSVFDEKNLNQNIEAEDMEIAGSFFKGSISNITVYNKALGFDEVKAEAEKVPVGSFTISEYFSTTVSGVVPELPGTVKLNYENGAVVEKEVTWNEINKEDFKTPGTVKVEGTVEGIDKKAVATIKVLAELPNDEFNSEELKDIWEIEREVSDKWSLTNNPGKLTITGTAGYNDNKDRNDNDNIFLQERLSEDYVITTKIEGKPSAGYQSGGVLAYTDADNYARIARKNVGNNIISYSIEVNGVAQHVEVADPIPGEDIYLALEKKGNQYIGYFSEDGETWTKLGDKTADIGNHKVGLYATNGTGPVYTAKFDYFRYMPYSPSTTVEMVAPIALTVKKGSELTLPLQTKLTLSNGETSNVLVDIENFDKEILNAVGTHTLTGKVIGTDIEVTVTITVEKDGSDEVIVVGKPSGLRSSEITSNSVSLTWNSPSETAGLVGYVIYKDGKVIGEVEANNFTAEELKSNTIYGFKVASKYSNGEESKPVSVNVRTNK